MSIPGTSKKSAPSEVVLDQSNTAESFDPHSTPTGTDHSQDNDSDPGVEGSSGIILHPEKAIVLSQESLPNSDQSLDPMPTPSNAEASSRDNPDSNSNGDSARSKSKGVYYAVVAGRNVGIFNTWWEILRLLLSYRFSD